jgi:hypothetical protein
MVLSADRQGSFLFTQALQNLPCCAAVPANRRICAHAARPDAIIYPMGLAEGDQGIVECHVSYIQESRRGTERRLWELEHRECNVGMAVGSK